MEGFNIEAYREKNDQNDLTDKPYVCVTIENFGNDIIWEWYDGKGRFVSPKMPDVQKSKHDFAIKIGLEALDNLLES